MATTPFPVGPTKHKTTPLHSATTALLLLATPSNNIEPIPSHVPPSITTTLPANGLKHTPKAIKILEFTPADLECRLSKKERVCPFLDFGTLYAWIKHPPLTPPLEREWPSNRQTLVATQRIRP